MKDVGQHTRFTNLYIKNFGEEVSDEDLNEMFSQFGSIVSAVVMKDKVTGKSRRYGFVSFEDHIAAQQVSFLTVLKYSDVAGFVAGHGKYAKLQDQNWPSPLCLQGPEEEGTSTRTDA